MPFLQISGVPVIDMYYDCDDSSHIKCYPLYHTMYDTFNLISNLTDKGFKYSKALTQIWAEMLRSLSDSPLLPFRDSLQYYPHFLYLALDDLKNNFMYEAIDDFDSAVNWFINSSQIVSMADAINMNGVTESLAYHSQQHYLTVPSLMATHMTPINDSQQMSCSENGQNKPHDSLDTPPVMDTTSNPFGCTSFSILNINDQ
ncbi:unnamed protein product [Oppiella nova]|uniref:Uncharacterized protein n=1 Tax=Oppiella nova TaxID=334625 RepID=A0A7R9QWC9_9ACAR|nr:unnamed protein product [Oppiella nova]CAG2176418.1 unnamed protein product [Oppiella nova]